MGCWRHSCVALDAQDNIYVTDSESGKIFVFDADGKYRHALGSLKGGEGYFKRPTGIAVDSAAQRIYVTDTLRDKNLCAGYARACAAEHWQARGRERRVLLPDGVAPRQ